MVSDMIPHLGGLVDEVSFLHSLTSKSNTHGPAENFLSTGFVLDGFPSIGAWVSYALGSEKENLPAFVAIPDPRGVRPARLTRTPLHAKSLTLPHPTTGEPVTVEAPMPADIKYALEILRVVTGRGLKRGGLPPSAAD